MVAILSIMLKVHLLRSMQRNISVSYNFWATLVMEQNTNPGLFSWLDKGNLGFYDTIFFTKFRHYVLSLKKNSLTMLLA